MKTIFNFPHRIRLIVFLFFCPLLVCGQNSLGKFSLVTDSHLGEKARSLYERGSKDSYTSHSSSFQAIAFPSNRIGEKEIFLDYRDREFVVRIGDREIYPDLPNWQLVPIVYFANSPYQGLFNLLGDTKNGEAQYKFHPAFLDNLLGLRLFQTSLLTGPEALGDIPRNKNGEAVLADSEKGLMPPYKADIYQSLFNELDKNKTLFNRYILTDKDLEIIFDIEGDELTFSDNPYYYFSKIGADTTNITNLAKEVEACYKEIEDAAEAFLKEKYTPKLNPRTNLRGLLIALDENRANEIFNPYSLHYIKKTLDKLDNLDRAAVETLSSDFRALPDLTAAFKKNWKLLKQYNPLVYSAAENTSRWAAFFRYVRLTNPDNWERFVRKIDAVVVIDAPDVSTPTGIAK